MRQERIKAIIFTTLLFGGLAWWLIGKPGLSSHKGKNIKSATHKTSKNSNSKSKRIATGTIIDSYKGVSVYYNGSVRHVNGRNKTKDGYNLGLKYQCVEFVKRFFYETFNHKMPDSYGHAKDFFNAKYRHGSINKERNMYQFENNSSEKPKVNDLIVIGPSNFNKFGHLVIVTKIYKNEISFVQQNPGPKNPSRGKFKLDYNNGLWSIKTNDILGWLRVK